MISVDQALSQLFSLVSPMGSETVPLISAMGRVLAEPVTATRTQPPFAASAMDGYAISNTDAKPGDVFAVIGESAAGHGFEGAVALGQAVRIFTGAPVPKGTERVIIQEDVTRDGDQITLNAKLDKGLNIRPAGCDFAKGTPLPAPRILTSGDIALLAAMNIPRVPVVRQPEIALISTGSELVMPGEVPGPDQIIASNSFGLKALLDATGARCRLLPIARDTALSLQTAFEMAQGADVIITIGGASVGDHDLVQQVASDLGLRQEFYKVAMRPGKPLMAGRMGDAMMIGLPGNPVSAMVCGHVFVVPVVRAFLGLGQAPNPRLQATLQAPLTANGPREHYMRAQLSADGIIPHDRQDSGLLSVLAEANALLIRPPHDPARAVGEVVEYIKV